MGEIGVVAPVNFGEFVCFNYGKINYLLFRISRYLRDGISILLESNY